MKVDDRIFLKFNDFHIPFSDGDLFTLTLFDHTLIQAPEGQTISGEIIEQAFEESSRTKKPMGKILQRLLADASVTTILTAGNGVPKMTKRSGKK